MLFFERALLTDQVKSIFRSHEDGYNAQEEYDYMPHFHASSVGLEFIASNQLHYLVTTVVE